MEFIKLTSFSWHKKSGSQPVQLICIIFTELSTERAQTIKAAVIFYSNLFMQGFMIPRTWHNNLQRVLIEIWRSPVCLQTLRAKHDVFPVYCPEATWSGRQLPCPAERPEELRIRKPSVPVRFPQVQPLPSETAKPSDVHLTERSEGDKQIFPLICHLWIWKLLRHFSVFISTMLLISFC